MMTAAPFGFLTPGGKGARGARRRHVDRRAFQSRATLPILIMIVAASAVVSRLLFSSEPTDLFDEGFALVDPTLILHGGVPNRTFFTGYGPANYDLLAVAFRVFGSSQSVERTVWAAYAAVAACGAGIVIVRRVGFIAGAAAAELLIGLVDANILMADAYLLAVALALCALLCADMAEGSLHRGCWLWLMGLFLGLTIASRCDVGLGLAVGCAILCLRKGQWMAVLAGAAIGMIPQWINLSEIGVVATIRYEVYDPIVRERAGRSLPLSNLDHSMLLLLGVSLIAVCAQGIVAFWSRDRFDVALAVFLLAIMPQEFQRADAPHVLDTALVAVPVAVLAVWDIARDALGRG